MVRYQLGRTHARQKAIPRGVNTKRLTFRPLDAILCTTNHHGDAMNPFTQDAMNRPLFEEPGPHIERVDPFSGPQGFLFGDQSGMGGTPDSLSLAQDYMEAAYALTDAIRRGECEDFRVAEPLMYLYRHSLELFLKGVLGFDEKHHDLVALADKLVIFIRQKHGVKMPNWIPRRIKEIAAIDPRSTAFRYGKTFDPKAGVDRPISGASYVSLPHLQDAMVALNWAIASMVAGPCTAYMEALVARHAQRSHFRDQDYRHEIREPI